MNPLALVQLTGLMNVTSGRPEMVVGLLDGPIVMNHPDLAGGNIRQISASPAGTCSRVSSAACVHGTFVAGILSAKRGSAAPAICPGCTVVLRPIFAELASRDEPLPSATPEELAAAIVECIAAGARVINLSSAFAQPTSRGESELEAALDHAARRGVLVVAAAGNQATLGSSAITRHRWVIPVAACDRRGRPIGQTNLGHSIGRRGLSAPGDAITSLGTAGKPLTSGGTSVAAAFVTGAIALLWSELPATTATEMRVAITQAHAPRRTTVVPPLLDGRAAYQAVLSSARARRWRS